MFIIMVNISKHVAFIPNNVLYNFKISVYNDDDKMTMTMKQNNTD